MLLATLLLGMAEVLRDNSAQTIMPGLVDPSQLEKANGRLWSIEAIANTFVGPPLGSLLLLGAFALPFFVDAGVVLRRRRARGPDPRHVPRRARPGRSSPVVRAELGEGVRWLMGHRCCGRWRSSSG